ncbi:MAG: succinate dehydrogenase, hydrophobic membrane anchor protein [Alphaproteobacteria bacterium]|nr:succinate dehydrogenase, hydrophobic membrane anchor protein [Alphaproteobacteria bacterium]
MQKASLLKWNKGGFKNPLTRARGLGAGHGAVHHWVMQRLSAILAVPLTFWLCAAITGHVYSSYASFTAWLSQPCNAILMALSIITFFYHACIGMQVVIEDYCHNELGKVIKLAALRIVMFAGAIASLFAVLKIAI